MQWGGQIEEQLTDSWRPAVRYSCSQNSKAVNHFQLPPLRPSSASDECQLPKWQDGHDSSQRTSGTIYRIGTGF